MLRIQMKNMKLFPFTTAPLPSIPKCDIRGDDVKLMNVDDTSLLDDILAVQEAAAKMIDDKRIEKEDELVQPEDKLTEEEEEIDDAPEN